MFSNSTLQHYLGIINQNRQSYSSGFRPGAQTLESRKFDEEKRQYEQNFAEDKFRDRRNFRENVRQFNAKLAADAVAGSSNSGGSGSGDGGTKLKDFSEKERESLRVNSAYMVLKTNYDGFSKMKNKEGKPVYQVPFRRSIEQTTSDLLGMKNSVYTEKDIVMAVNRLAGELAQVNDTNAIAKAQAAGGSYWDTTSGKKNKYLYDAAFPNKTSTKTSTGN